MMENDLNLQFQSREEGNNSQKILRCLVLFIEHKNKKYLADFLKAYLVLCGFYILASWPTCLFQSALR